MKRTSFAACFVLACGVWTGAPAQTPPASEKEQNIRRLLSLMNPEGFGVQSVDVGRMSQMFASLPEETRTKVINFIKDEMSRELSAEKVIDLSVPIYARHLSEDEVKSILAFYETPAGRKYLSVAPLINTEMNHELERAGKEAWAKTLEKIRAQGVSNPPAPQQAPPPPKGRP